MRYLGPEEALSILKDNPVFPGITLNVNVAREPKLDTGLALPLQGPLSAFCIPGIGIGIGLCVLVHLCTAADPRLGACYLQVSSLNLNAGLSEMLQSSLLANVKTVPDRRHGLLSIHVSLITHERPDLCTCKRWLTSSATILKPWRTSISSNVSPSMGAHGFRARTLTWQKLSAKAATFM